MSKPPTGQYNPKIEVLHGPVYRGKVTPNKAKYPILNGVGSNFKDPTPHSHLVPTTIVANGSSPKPTSNA